MWKVAPRSDQTNPSPERFLPPLYIKKAFGIYSLFREVYLIGSAKRAFYPKPSLLN